MALEVNAFNAHPVLNWVTVSSLYPLYKGLTFSIKCMHAMLQCLNKGSPNFCLRGPDHFPFFNVGPEQITTRARVTTSIIVEILL